MLSSTRQNFHHSKLPALGAIVAISRELCHSRPHLAGKWIVESFPLCDNIRPWSIGIHTVNLAQLGRRAVKVTVSGFYCEEVE